MRAIEKHLGDFGKYQALFYAILFLPGAISGCQTLLFSFTGAVPQLRCKLPFENSTHANYYNPLILSNFTLPYVYAPKEKEGGQDVYCAYCRKSSVSRATLDNTIANDQLCDKNDAESCNNGFLYDRSQYKSSLAMKFDMVCEGHWRRDLAKSMYMVGKLIGSVMFGMLSDRFGRRPIFLISALTGIISFNVVPVLPSFWLICVFQIVNGCVTYGAYLTAFVFVMELLGGIYKTVCGIWVAGFYTIGYIYVGVAAYFIRDWRILQWVVSFPAIFLIPYWWLIPESIRWQTVHDKVDDAFASMMKISKFNGIKINEHELRKDLKDAADEAKREQKATVAKLFSNRQLGLNTLIVFLTWGAVALAYYGIAYNADDLPGDVYTNFLVLGVMEIPGLIICIPLMEKFGRRFTLFSMMLLGGLACILSGSIPQHRSVAVITFAVIGKIFIAGAFAVVYNYSAEFYPTVVRQSACGVSSLVGRIGSISAPQVHLLGKLVAPWLPMLIYGCAAFIAGVLDIFLPETLNKPLPDTIAASVELCKSSRLCSCKERADDDSPVKAGMKSTNTNAFTVSPLETRL